MRTLQNPPSLACLCEPSHLRMNTSSGIACRPQSATHAPSDGTPALKIHSLHFSHWLHVKVTILINFLYLRPIDAMIARRAFPPITVARSAQDVRRARLGPRTGSADRCGSLAWPQTEKSCSEKASIPHLAPYMKFFQHLYVMHCCSKARTGDIVQELAFFLFDPGALGLRLKIRSLTRGGLTLRHQPSPRLSHTGRQYISHLEKDLAGSTTCFAVARAPRANWRCLGNALEGQLGLVGPNPSCANHSGWCPGERTWLDFVR